MTRMILGLAGVLLLAVVALGALWLLGQVLVGAGLIAAGTAGVLLHLLWFLGVSGVLGGAVYFVGLAWRPASRGLGQAQRLVAQAGAAAPVSVTEPVANLVVPGLAVPVSASELAPGAASGQVSVAPPHSPE